MPTAGSLSQVSFTGGRAAALSDGFYYSVDAEAGVQIARGGLRAGDEYVLRGVEAEPVELATIAAPGGAPTGSTVSVPPNLEAWVDAHRSGSGGAALDGLVSLLRERGYLSHALAITPEEPPAWMASLADYSFQPSAAGHSLARIDTLFGRLLERENDPRAEASGNYVAAIGDDEQFAVAVSLIAQHSASRRASSSAHGWTLQNPGSPRATPASAARKTSRCGPKFSPMTGPGCRSM